MHEQTLPELSTEVNADVDPHGCAVSRCAEPASRARRRPSQLRTRHKLTSRMHVQVGRECFFTFRSWVDLGPAQATSTLTSAHDRRNEEGLRPASCIVAVS